MTTPVPPAETTQASTVDLGARFPTLSPLRLVPAYKGWIVPKENLVEVATAHPR